MRKDEKNLTRVGGILARFTAQKAWMGGRIDFTKATRRSEVKLQGELGISESSFYTHSLGKVMQKSVYRESKLSLFAFLRLGIVHKACT